MAKVPYMPLYIGDWLQDMDAVSLECEAAWLRIVFKMFKNGKSGLYKIDAKGLQRLWKCDANTMQMILQELILEGIGEVKEENGIYTFKNRRMIKERAISETRRKASKKRWDLKQTSSKQHANIIQNPEIDNEDEYEGDNETDDFEKSEKLLTVPEKLDAIRIQDETASSRLWQDDLFRKGLQDLFNLDEDSIKGYWQDFWKYKRAGASVVDREPANKIREHFRNWLNKRLDNGNGEPPQIDHSKI